MGESRAGIVRNGPLRTPDGLGNGGKRANSSHPSKKSIIADVYFFNEPFGFLRLRRPVSTVPGGKFFLRWRAKEKQCFYSGRGFRTDGTTLSLPGPQSAGMVEGAAEQPPGFEADGCARDGSVVAVFGAAVRLEVTGEGGHGWPPLDGPDMGSRALPVSVTQRAVSAPHPFPGFVRC